MKTADCRRIVPGVASEGQQDIHAPAEEQMALDEATSGLLEQLAASGTKPITEMTPQEARDSYALLAEFTGPGPEMASVREERLSAAGGGDFGVRVLVPDGEVRGLIVYYHGGGWVIGSMDECDALCRTLAVRLGAAVVNVDYRLAPEHPYPAGPDDCWTALEWVSERATEITGGPVPLIVMGDSAGGNLSAVVAQRALAAGGPRIDCQVLIYPVTDSDFGRPGYADPANQLMLTADSMIWFWGHYVPDPADRLHPDVAPLRAASLAGLPPAIVLTAEYDVLRQEGEAYADRLREAGVPVEQKRFAGQMHGFFTMLNIVPGSSDAIDYLVGQLGPRLTAA
jgi:acetyl esterase